MLPTIVKRWGLLVLLVTLVTSVSLFTARTEIQATHAPPGPDLWGFQSGPPSLIGQYNLVADVPVPAPCLPFPPGGNGRAIAFDPVDGNLWYTALGPGLAGLGLIFKATPTPGCAPLAAIPFGDGPGGAVQDDIGALDVDPDDGHLWAAGHAPQAGGTVSVLYKVNRVSGAIIGACGVPYGGGGGGNDTLTVARIPGLPGSGKYLLTDAGDLITAPAGNGVLLIVDAASCGGLPPGPGTVVAALPKAVGMSGIDFEQGNLIATNGTLIFDLGGPPFLPPAAVMPCVPTCNLEDITLKPVLITVEKDYRFTSVCFEKDNDGDGQFSEDPVEPVDPQVDNDIDGKLNEDGVDCPGGTSLGGELPTDASGNFIVEAVITGGTISSYNPGQYYAVSTVQVLNNPASLLINEIFADCTEGPAPLSALNPGLGGGGGSVAIVAVGPDGVARQIADAKSPNVTVGDTIPAGGNGVPDSASALLANVAPGTTILMYVKFGPGLKDQPLPGDTQCGNANLATVPVGGTLGANAGLVVVPKP